MYDVEPVRWSPREADLWHRIAAHPFERPDDALDFTRRLARDRGWSLAYARGAVAAYRRFCFLAVTCGVPVTPSEEVDEVWHQHLTYSRDYWDRWCGDVLRTPLHHDPTEGGHAADRRYRTQYAETLALHEAWFGIPDQAYWPATHLRFRGQPRFRVVDRARTLVLPWRDWIGTVRAGAGLCLAGLLVMLGAEPARAAASDLPLNPFDWPARPFLTLYGGFCLAAVATTLALCLRKRSIHPVGRSGPPTAEAVAETASDLDLLQLAWLAGGRGRAAAMVLAAFVEAGAARLIGGGLVGLMRLPEIEVDGRGIALLEPFAAFREAVRGRCSYRDFLRAVAPDLVAVKDDLTRRGLVPDGPQVVALHLRIAAIPAAVVVFGLIRVAVGHARDKPVGYLLAMIVGTVVVTLITLVITPARTSLGSAVLDHLRRRYTRAASSPREHEVLFAFALSGVAVLAGTHLAALGRLIRANGGSGGDGGGGSGDGGGGGGGCGGCGGGGGD